MADASIWRRRIEAWRASGMTAREFAAGKDFAEGTLRWWAWRFEKGARRVGSVSAPRIVRVVRRSDDGAQADAGSRAGLGLTIEIGSARVSVGAGVDRAALRDVLDVLCGLERERAR